MVKLLLYQPWKKAYKLLSGSNKMERFGYKGDIDAWQIQWKDLFLTTAHNAIPSVKWKRCKMKSWLSYNTIELIKKKRSLYHKCQHNPHLRSKYTQLHNLVRKAIRTDYASYADIILKQFYSLPRLELAILLFLCKHPTSDTLLTSDYD